MRATLFLLLFFFCFTPTWAASVEHIPLLKVSYLGKDLTLENGLIKKNGTLYISIQECLPHLGATMTYLRKEDAFQISFQKNTTRFQFAPNTYEYWVNRTQSFFSAPPIYSENVLFVPLGDFFSSLGFLVEEKGNRVCISKTTPSASLSSNPTASVTLLWGGKHYILEETFLKEGYLWANMGSVFSEEGIPMPVTNNISVIQKNGHPYVQLASLFKSLNMTFSYNKETQVATVLSQIYAIRVNKHFHTAHLQLFSHGSLQPNKPLPLSSGKGFYLDIPQSEKRLKNDISLEDSPIAKIDCRPLNDSTVRLTLILNEAVGYSSLIPTPFGGEIRFYNPIQSIKERHETNSQTVHIKGRFPILYSVGLFDHPRRLVLDIPDATSQIAPLVVNNPKGVYYTRIRSSQFQINPSKTRIVFDLTKASAFTFHREGNRLDVTFTENSTAPLTLLPVTTNSVVVKPPPKLLLLENKVIVIDPGHGGDDPGALSHTKEFEKEFTLDISKRLQTLLTQEGAYVIMCREGDQNPTLEDRTRVANINKTDIFISVHINSFFNSFSVGTETYYYKNQDKLLTELIHEELIKSLQLPDKGIKKARLYVLRNSTMPATLIEPLFITNEKEFALLKQASFRQKIAESVTKGVERYFRKH